MDYFGGDHSAKIAIHRDDGHTDDMAISTFFRKPLDFPRLERTALDLCQGYVLDVGAGAGPDSLALQERGLSVCAIDISPEARTTLSFSQEGGVAGFSLRQKRNIVWS